MASKMSGTTKDTAELNVKHVKHKVINQNGARLSLHVQVS